MLQRVWRKQNPCAGDRTAYSQCIYTNAIGLGTKENKEGP